MNRFLLPLLGVLLFISCSKEQTNSAFAKPVDKSKDSVAHQLPAIDTFYYAGIRWLDLQVGPDDTVSFYDTVIAVKSDTTLCILHMYYNFASGSGNLSVWPGYYIYDTLKQIAPSTYFSFSGAHKSLLYKSIYCNHDSFAYNMLTETYSCTVFLHDTINAMRIK